MELTLSLTALCWIQVESKAEPGHLYALKAMPMNEGFTVLDARDELENLKDVLDCPDIVKCHTAYLCEPHFYVCTAQCAAQKSPARCAL